MVTAQITLTDQESMALRAIAQQLGKTEDELIREAVEQFITQFRQAHRRALLEQARGMWKDRTDLPVVETLRREFDRF
jgi:predicted transcriptional regulator